MGRRKKKSASQKNQGLDQNVKFKEAEPVQNSDKQNPDSSSADSQDFKANINLNTEENFMVFNKVLNMRLLSFKNLEETNSTIVVNIAVDGIHHHPTASIDFKILKTSLKLNVKDLKGEHAIYRANRLAHEIVPEKSTFNILTDKVQFVLWKKTSGYWNSLLYVQPEIMTKFIKRYYDFVDSLPSFTWFHVNKWDALNYGRYFAESEYDSSTELNILRDTYPGLSKRKLKDLIDDVRNEIEENKIEWSQFNEVAQIIINDVNEEYYQAHPELESDRIRKQEKIEISTRVIGDSEEERRAERLKEEGNKHFREKRFHDAIRAYTSAIHLVPDCVAYYINRSFAFKEIKEIEFSLNDLYKALRYEPFNSKVSLSIAKLGMHRMDFKLAKDYLIIAARLDFQTPGITEQHKEMRKLKLIKEEFENYLMFEDDISKSTSFLFKFQKQPHLIINVLIDGVGAACRKNKVCKVKEFLGNVSNLKRMSLLYPPWVCFIPIFHCIIAFYEDDEAAVDVHFTKFFCSFPPASEFEPMYKKMKKLFSLRKVAENAFLAGQLEEAISVYSKCLEIESDSIMSSKILLKRAEAKLKQGRREKAISDLNSAIDKKNDYAEAFAMRGDCYLYDGRNDEAIKDFERANQLSPCDRYQEQLKTIRGRKSSTRTVSDEFSSSTEEICTKEKGLQKALADIKKEKGNQFYKSQRYSDAIKAYSEAIELHSTDPVYFSNRSACLMMLNNFKDALKDSKTALLIEPSFAKGYIRLASCHIALGEAKEAINVLKNGTKLNLSEGELKSQLDKAQKLMEATNQANLFLSNNDFQKADQQLTMATELSQACIPLRLKRIKCLLQLMEYDKALTVSKEVLSLEDDCSEALYLAALCFYYNGCKTEALSHLAHLLSLNENNLEARELKEKITTLFDLKDLGNKAYTENRLEEALSIFQKGLMKDPKNKALNSVFYLNIGLVYIQKGNWKKGVESFSFAIGLQKDYVEAYLKRAECLLNLGRNEEAVKDYEAVCHISSSSKHKKLLEEAKASLNKPLSQLTEREMELALAEIKKDKGNLLFRKKEYESSLAYYTEAISLNPGCPAYFTNRSACHLMLRRYADCLQDAKEAIKMDSTFVKGFIRFGKCQLALGNVTEAFDAFGKAKELDSTHEDVVDGLARSHRLKNNLVEGEKAMEENQFGKALKLFESASKIACGCGEILLKRALCLISLQRTEEVSHLIEALPIDLKENSEVLFMKGMFFYHQDRKEEALEHLHNALKCDSPNTKAKARELVEQIHGVYENLENGESALRRLDTTEALRLFRKGLEIDPKNRCLQAKFHLKIGTTLMDQNKLSDAIVSFSNAIDMIKDNAEALKLRGQCYQKQKEHKKAVADFQKLVKIFPCGVYRTLLNDAQDEATKVETLPKDYYKILGVPREATMDSIRKSYKALALQFHPDRMSSASEKSRGEEKFKEISEAYAVLIDPLKRERYDRGEYENGSRDRDFDFEFNPFMFRPNFFNAFLFHQMFRNFEPRNNGHNFDY